MKPFFLNVDLDIFSRTNLKPIHAEVEKHVLVLYFGPINKSGKHLLSIENSHFFKTPEPAINRLCSIIENFSESSRRMWQRSRRQFHIGYELRKNEKLSYVAINPKTLKRIAALGAELKVTFYREEPDGD